MAQSQALIRSSFSPARNGDAVAAQPAKVSPAAEKAPPPLTDELVAQILHGRGLRGWLRLARVARVLGLFTLYLFLDTYDVRADFNRRMAQHRSNDAKSKGWLARTRAG